MRVSIWLMKLMPRLGARAWVIVLATLLCAWRVAGQTNGAVTILEPQDGQRFNPRTNITLTANADIPAVKSLEFLSDGKSLGSVSNQPYSLIWSNVPTGTYSVVARAFPQSGAAVDSAAIEVRVYNAYLTFGLDRVGMLQRHKLFDIPLWQYVAVLVYIFLAFYISKILDFLTRVWLRNWARKTATTFDDLLLNLLNGPIKIVAFIVFLRIGLEIFSWPALVQTILSKSFIVIVASTLTYVAIKFIDLAMGYWKQRVRPEADKSFEEQLFPVIRKTLKVFVVVVAVLVTLANIGVNINAALASLSIGGLAVGLAAQDTLANLFGAVAVFVDKPFRVGDRIQLTGVDGTVESIGMRSTRVRDLDGYHITIPNKTMGNATITNVTRRPNIKTEMNFGLTYETSAEKLKLAAKILQEIYGSHPQTHDLLVSFNKFTDSTLNILVVHWWKGTDGKAYLAGLQEMNLKVKERFEAEKLGFAFPSQTLYLKQDSDWRLVEN